ncbi:MAG TPA: hypothetical protein VM532_06595, partial [Burkholderiales bacterium]|nr:hypothetical protein [Burkholderiales bacterium]
AQRKALDDEFKGGWFAEFGRGQQAKDRARAIDPPECKPGCTKETLETLRSAFFVARPGTERGGEKTKTKLLYAVADDMPDDKKADIVNGESVSFTIGRRSNSKTRGH